MKTLMSLFILFSLFNAAFAKNLNKPKKISSPKYSNVICKQKYIPMKIEQTLNSHLLTVKFIAQRPIDQFTIKNVRGIDGVAVTKYQEQNQAGIQSGESLTSDVELSDFSGLVYVVFDVTITINGVTSGHSIPIPVGQLSIAQKRERAKKIKDIKLKIQTKDGTSPMSVPPKKVHEMQAE